MTSKLHKIWLLLLLVSALVPYACGSPATTESQSPATSPSIPAPPSAEELAQQGFILPEFPRITSQQLRQMIDAGKPCVIVDARIAFFYNSGHIPGAINIPYESGNARPAAFLTLPLDRPIIFYADSDDDFDSAASASRLLKMEAGFRPENVLVLWKGYFWWKRLQYPVVT